MKPELLQELNRLASRDVVAIPLLTATLALLLEYWALEIGEYLPWIDATGWSLVIFHALLVGLLYANVVWDEIEEQVEETAEEKAFVWGDTEE